MSVELLLEEPLEFHLSQPPPKRTAGLAEVISQLQTSSDPLNSTGRGRGLQKEEEECCGCEKNSLSCL